MNTLSVIFCWIDWQPIIKEIPCLCWGILGLLLVYMLLKYVIAPLIANCHEMILKDKMFEQEKFWCFQKNMKCDSKKVLEDKSQKE